MTVQDVEQLELNARYLVDHDVPLPPVLTASVVLKAISLSTGETLGASLISTTHWKAMK